MANIAVAQSVRLDSLRQLISKTSGTERVDVLNEYGGALLSYDNVKAREAIHEAYLLGEKLNYQKGMVASLISEGILESSLGNDSLSRKAFTKSLALSRKINAKELEGNSLIHIGVAFQNQNHLDSAFRFFTEAYAIEKDSLYPSDLSFLYFNLSKYHELQNNPSLQFQYLNRSWNISRAMKVTRDLVWSGTALVSYFIQQGDYATSLKHLDEIQSALGADTVDNEYINLVRKQRGIIFANQGNYKMALSLFDQVKKFYERNAYPLELSNLFGEMGYVLADVSNYETSLKYYFKALRLAEDNNYMQELARLNFRIAWVYYLLEQNKLAHDFCWKAYRIARGHHFSFDESSALNLLGMLADRDNENEKALSYFNQSLELRKKNNFRDRVASTLLNIGILYEKLGDYKKAEEYDLRSLAIEEEIHHSIGICYSYQTLGQLYTRRKNFAKAAVYLSKGESLSKKIKAADVLRDIYKNKRDFYHLQSKYPETVRYSLLYENIKDSLFSQSLSNRISTMQYDFELDQKDKEIKILGQQQELQKRKLELQQAEIKQQRFIIAIVLIILVNISIGAYIIYRFYKRVKKLNHEVAEQNEEITAQSEELMEANVVLSKLNREISEQKEEIQAQTEELVESNQVISRVNEGLEEKIKARTKELKEAYTELDTFFYRSSHDFRRPLTTFMGLAEVAKVTLKDRAALELFEKVNETAHNLDKMLMKLQSISVAGSQELIYSEVMIAQIFELELDHFKHEIVGKSIQVLTEVDLSRPFFSYPVLIKSIVQNLLENSVSFSTAQSPMVKLKAFEMISEVVIEVADNGQGIDPVYLPRVFDMYFRANERSRGNGLGLYIVKKMVDKLNGRIELKSELHFGTTIRIFLPNHFREK
jgi:signal transduction histidine kinase